MSYWPSPWLWRLLIGDLAVMAVFAFALDRHSPDWFTFVRFAVFGVLGFVDGVLQGRAS